MNKRILVIGAGLAGSDCAHYLASFGLQVILCEGKAIEPTPAQKIKTYGELVCTNSLKSMDESSAHGLLKTEMQSLGSLVLECAYKTKVPAGDALAVDRELFSQMLTEKIRSHENIEIKEETIIDPLEAQKRFNCDYVVVATGPLTHPKLENWIEQSLSDQDLYFYDAIAPVVDADTLDISQMYFKDRHKEHDESADYLNVPLTQEQYYKFIEELNSSDKVPAQNFEDFKYFEACLPIDVMAERGKDTPRFSCMKPIGLERKDGSIPFAVIQLRKENLLGSAYNLVGFQTKLKYPEQLRVFRTLPGFQDAQFHHLGSVHRNTFLNAQKLLNFDLSTKKYDELYFAGQITGVEGYTESAAMGLYVAHQILRRIQDKEPIRFPVETAMGALVNYIMTCTRPSPSSINFGLLPKVELTKEQRRSRERKKIKKQLASLRARKIFNEFLGAQ